MLFGVAFLWGFATPLPGRGDERSPDRERCELTRQPASAAAACTRRLADPGLAPLERAETLRHRAEADDALGEAGLARTDIDEAIRLDPDQALSHLLRARLALAAGDQEVALSDLTVAIEHHIDEVPARRARAELFLAQGRNEEAVADFDKVLAAVPEDGAALLERGVARWRALDIHSSASGPDAGSDGFARLQNQMCAEGRVDCPAVTSALADIERAIDRLAGSDRATALIQRAMVLAARGEARRALADCDAALQLRPDDPVFLFERASIRMALGDTPGAGADLDHGLVSMPDDPGARLKRARLRLQAGDLEGARADVRIVMSRPLQGRTEWLAEIRDLRQALSMPEEMAELTGIGIASAGVRQDQSGREIVSIRLDPASGKRFAAFTLAHIGAVTEVLVDGAVVAQPRIINPITEGSIDLSGVFSHAEAVALAARLATPNAAIRIMVIE